MNQSIGMISPSTPPRPVRPYRPPSIYGHGASTRPIRPYRPPSIFGSNLEPRRLDFGSIETEMKNALVLPKCCTTSECSICMSSSDDTVILPCNHTFHMGCISRWYMRSNSCPNCRAPIV